MSVRARSWRQQPPAFAPLPVSAIAHAFATELRRDADPRVQLAAELAISYESPVVHLMQSGTAALQVAIRLGSSFTGDGPVALPAFGCYDVASAAVGAAVPIMLYDVDPRTLAPDIESLTSRLAAGARLVVVAPFASVPVDWDELNACLSAYGAMAIEDAAQGHGASWRGKRLGSFGPISVLSFSRGKGWTGARGGALLLRDPSIARFARGLSLPKHTVRETAEVAAASLALSAFSYPSLFAIPSHIPWLHVGETRYRVPREPRQMTRLTAALLLASRHAAHTESVTRRKHAAAMLSALPGGAHVRPVTVPESGCAGYLRLPLRVTGGFSDLASVEPARRFGIAPTYPSTLASLPQVRARLRGSGPWPGADALVRELITLPTHGRVTPREREALVNMMIRWQRGRHAARHTPRWFGARSFRAT